MCPKIFGERPIFQVNCKNTNEGAKLSLNLINRLLTDSIYVEKKK